jgi:3-oxoacyl-[acyl-carrier protein] reductase
MNSGLEGHHILVTGASGGIGQAACRAFDAAGANITLHYHKGRSAIERLTPALQGEITACAADLTIEDDVAALFTHATTALGRISGIIVNAGIWPAETVSVADMSMDRWETTLKADLTSAFLTCRAYLQHLRSQPGEVASIVLIGSTAALYGEAGHADYAAAKAGMTHGLTYTLKNEIIGIARLGRVNCICPGWVDTPMSAAAMQDHFAVQRATSTMALRKVARPEDIAASAVHLSSPTLAGHISGAILPVSGGMEGRLLHHDS